ncbi:MAG: glycosyl transferase [Planctomycetota bacterium]|nr:MAG: glycosyl transferase [Planctomycetota bacterium]
MQAASGGGRGGRPVRVLRVIARLNVGGPARHVVALAAGLRSRGFQTVLAVGRLGPHEADMSDLAARAGVPLVQVPGLGRAVRPWDDLRALAALWQLCRRWRPHLVHTHTAKAGALGRMAAVLAGVPRRVHTFHGHVLRGYFGAMASEAIRAAERLLAQCSDAVVVLSPAQRRELVGELRVVPRRRARVIPLGLELAPYRAAAAERAALRAALGLAPSTALIGWFGRLVPIKRGELALQALALLVRGGVDAVLAVAGEGPERPRLERLACSLGLGPRVRWLGVRRPLAPWYGALDALLVTSRNEGTPLVVIEALAAGLPVVATAVGGLPDLAALAPGAVTLVPPERAGALAQALARLLADPHARAHAAATGPAAAEHFALERLLERTARLYRELLAGRAPPDPRA